MLIPVTTFRRVNLTVCIVCKVCDLVQRSEIYNLQKQQICQCLSVNIHISHSSGIKETASGLIVILCSRELLLKGLHERHTTKTSNGLFMKLSET